MKFFPLASAAIASFGLAACGGTAETSDMASSPAMGSADMSTQASTMDPMMSGDGMVEVTINGVKPGEGKLFVALQDSGNFLQAAGTYKTKVDADGPMVVATFEDVEPGTYAAAVIHDENADGSVELGGRGPTEAWGLSGSEQSGKPEWMPATFTVDASGAGSTMVTLSYD